MIPPVPCAFSSPRANKIHRVFVCKTNSKADAVMYPEPRRKPANNYHQKSTMATSTEDEKHEAFHRFEDNDSFVLLRVVVL